MSLFPKGEICLNDNFNNWSINVEVKWNNRMTNTIIKSKKLDLNSNFVSCKLSKSHILTLLSYTLLSYTFSHRSESYNFKGSKSEYSDIILKSRATIPLMESKNASIELKNNYMIFSGGTRKKDISSLSNIFKLNEMLMTDIDESLPTATEN